MNQVIISGRLTRDPDVRYTQGNNMCIAKYTLAVSRNYRKEGEATADFINCTAFGKIAEFAKKYFRQGMRIEVIGRWQTGSYTNKDGMKVYTNDCIVEKQEFGQSKSESQKENRNAQSATEPVSEADDGFMSIPDGLDEELPFQ